MSNRDFSYSYRVPYSDCTLGNHIYYSRYLDIFEVARGEMFRSLGISFDQWQQRGIIFPVIEASVRYRGAARYDDLLEVQIRIREAARIRLTFAYLLGTAKNPRLVEGLTAHVCTNLEDQPQRLPAELIQALEPFRE